MIVVMIDGGVGGRDRRRVSRRHTRAYTGVSIHTHISSTQVCSYTPLIFLASDILAGNSSK